MSGPVSFITGLCTRYVYVTYVSSEGFQPRSLTGSNEVGLSMADETGPSPRFGCDLRGSESDRFGGGGVRVRFGLLGPGFGFGSVSPGQVRVRFGFAPPGSDSDRRPVRFGFGIRTRGLIWRLVTMRSGPTGLPCGSKSVHLCSSQRQFWTSYGQY